MQSGKKAGESVKETAANIGATAKAGMEKTKATVQEKAEKVTARDPVKKDMATQKKEARVTQAERDKQAAREHNAAAKHSTTAGQMGHGTGTATHPTTGEYGQPVGAHHTSAMPGHGTGQPTGGHVTEGGQMGHGTGTATYPTTGEYGQPVGAHHTSAMPGHGTGQPTGGHVTEGVTGSHPIGGTGTAHNTRAGGNPNDYGHRTGGTYN